MSRGFPSMTALLGLLAVGGYQNRDKIAEMLGGIGKTDPASGGQGGFGGLLGQLTRIIHRGAVRSRDAADRGAVFRGVEDAGNLV